MTRRPVARWPPRDTNRTTPGHGVLTGEVGVCERVPGHDGTSRSNGHSIMVDFDGIADRVKRHPSKGGSGGWRFWYRDRHSPRASPHELGVHVRSTSPLDVERDCERGSRGEGGGPQMVPRGPV